MPGRTTTRCSRSSTRCVRASSRARASTAIASSAAILFENTMDREIEGKPTADYLWDVKKVVPILKVDKGLAEEQDGVQLMKPIPGLDALLEKAKIEAHLRHEDALGHQAGERERHRRDRASSSSRSASRSSRPGSCRSSSPRSTFIARTRPKAESCSRPASWRSSTSSRRTSGHAQAHAARGGQLLHGVHRASATSCGSSRSRAVTRATRPTRSSRATTSMVASFSRALAEGLTAQQSDAEFNAVLKASIESIFAASIT